MTNQTTSRAVGTAARSTAALPAAIAILLGLFFILGTGFAHSDAIHNAAHDARHAFAFPCH